MRNTVLSLLMLGACANVSFGQAAAKTVTIDDLSAPNSPAFTLLDVTPSSVDRPDNPKAFVMSLLNKVNSSNGFPQNYAVDVTPYWMVSHPTLTFDKYQSPSPGQSIAQSFLISVATVPIPGATASAPSLGTRLGLGFRTFVANGRSSKGVKAALGKAVKEILDVDFAINDLVFREGRPGVSEADKAGLITQEEVLRGKAKAIAAKIEAMDAERVGFFLALAGGQTWGFTEDDLSNSKAEKFGFWVTPSYRFKGCDETAEDCISSIDLIGVGRVLTEKDKEKRWDAGGRFVLRANKAFYLSFEALGRKDKNQPATPPSKNFRTVGMVEYRIQQDIILYGSFGRDFKKDTGAKPLVSLFGLNLGFGSKPILTAQAQ